MSNRGRFVCLAHNHANQVEEVECSAGFQLDRAEKRIAELEELCEIYVPEKILRQMRDKKSPPEGWGA